eukprot:gene28194-35010_t
MDIDNNLVTRTFTTQVMVTPNLHVDFLLGSNVAVDHNIIVIPDERKATMFRNKDTLVVKCMSWDEVQRSIMRKRQTLQQSVPIQCNMVRQGRRDEVDPHVELRDKRHETVVMQQYRTELKRRICAYCNAGSSSSLTLATSDIMNMVLENPFQFTKAGKHLQRDRFYLATLVVMAQQFGVSEVSDQVTLLDRVFLAQDRCLIGRTQMASEIERIEVQRAIDLVKLLTEVYLYKHPRAELVALNVFTFREVAVEFDAQVVKEQEEYDLSRKTVDYICTHLATSCMWELKPPEFHADYWPFVMDSIKPRVDAIWRSFDIDPMRRIETITAVMAIDISEETRARKLEMPLFRAQLLANLDCFAHPDKWNQPKIKGRSFTIDLREDDKEPAVARYQRFDQWQTRFLQLKVQRMIDEKRMERSDSEWNARLSLVPYTDRIQKFVLKHGDKVLEALFDDANTDEVLTFFRLTSDLRNLNNKTKPIIYPLPNISDIISKCEGCERYTTGDVSDAFFTVEMDPASRDKTAFTTPNGHYHYTVMPQGARNAAIYWAQMIAEVFKVMLDRNAPLIVYQDDIGNRARELLEHLEIQQEIYDTMLSQSMIFKPTKMHCNYKTQRILGHVLSGSGRVPDPKTIEAVTQLKPPTTLKEVRSVLGLFQYAREYIENMSTIMAPIQALTKKGVDIQETWDEKVHGAAFEALKIALTSAPILKIPDLSKPFKIQDDEGVLRPCQYWSRALDTAERRYSATDLECLALHDTILHWQVYLRNGHEFEVFVDHFALVYMVTKMSSNEQTNQRLLRLCLDLQGFNFSVTHVAGVNHLGADAVSRLLRHGEVPYVRDADDLREDFGPLTEEEKTRLQTEYSDDAWYLIRTINEHRESERLKMVEIEADHKLILEQQLAIEGPLVKPEVEALPAETAEQSESPVMEEVLPTHSVSENVECQVSSSDTVNVSAVAPKKLTFTMLPVSNESSDLWKFETSKRKPKTETQLDQEVENLINAQDQRISEQNQWWEKRRQDLESQFHAQEQVLCETELDNMSVNDVDKYIEIMKAMEINDREDQFWQQSSVEERQVWIQDVNRSAATGSGQQRAGQQPEQRTAQSSAVKAPVTSGKQQWQRAKPVLTKDRVWVRDGSTRPEWVNDHMDRVMAAKREAQVKRAAKVDMARKQQSPQRSRTAVNIVTPEVNVVTPEPAVMAIKRQSSGVSKAESTRATSGSSSATVRVSDVNRSELIVNRNEPWRPQQGTTARAEHDMARKVKGDRALRSLEDQLKANQMEQSGIKDRIMNSQHQYGRLGMHIPEALAKKFLEYEYRVILAGDELRAKIATQQEENVRYAEQLKREAAEWQEIQRVRQIELAATQGARATALKQSEELQRLAREQRQEQSDRDKRLQRERDAQVGRGRGDGRQQHKSAVYQSEPDSSGDELNRRMRARAGHDPEEGKPAKRSCQQSTPVRAAVL